MSIVSHAFLAIIVTSAVLGCSESSKVVPLAPQLVKVLPFSGNPALLTRDTTAVINLSQADLRSLTKGSHHSPPLAALGPGSRAPLNVTTASPYEHGHVGTYLYSTSTYNGVYATQSSDNFFRIANGGSILANDPNGNATYNVVFKDTTKAPGGNCFESGTGHWSNLNAFYVFDFCDSGGTFVVVKPISSLFHKYEQGNDAAGTATYTVQNYQGSDGNWYALLYNYNTSSWEQLYEESGSVNAGFTYGWSFSEYYNEPSSSGYCQVIGYNSYLWEFTTVKATAQLLAGSSSTLYDLTSSNAAFIQDGATSSYSSCLSQSGNATYPDYQFTYVGTSDQYTPGNSWQITTTWDG
jgi:hypothetical protein